METRHILKNYPAFGILESVVAIGVFGVTIVIGLSLLAKSLRIIKDNQINDSASSFVVSILEYVRSSDESVSTGFYSINLNPDNGLVASIVEQGGALELSEGAVCNSTSSFYIATDLDGDKGVLKDFCSQVAVDYVDPTNPYGSDYLIKSKILYKIRGEPRYIELVGIKRKY